MTIRAVVFDLDGTLVDSTSAAAAAYVDTVRGRGGPVLSPFDVMAIWHLGPTSVVLTELLGRAVDVEDIEEFHRLHEQRVAGLRPFAGVPAMLDVLRRTGFRVGVYTSATRRASRNTMHVAGLGGITTVVAGDDVRSPKPAPDGLRQACRSLRVAPAEAAYVGDADVDAQCAAAAGALFIRAGWGAAVTATARAEHLARSPSDIIRLVR